jgi:hypothetical protein
MLTQFRRDGDGHQIRVSDVGVGERPPAIVVPDYLGPCFPHEPEHGRPGAAAVPLPWVTSPAE